MGEPLPITRYRDEILAAVIDHSVTIIKAETGAGKSTQVPQFLLELFPKVTVTQPRRLAAMGIAERVAKEMNCEVGGLVGYRTSLDRNDSVETRILYCTDGLELVCELFGNETIEGVLVIDEVHEWNLNIETLVAWTRYQLNRGATYKVVIMSATVDAQAVANYFGNAAVVEVPGRTFPVTERKSGKGIAVDAAKLLRTGHNVLMFQPGKAEIEQTIDELRKMDVKAEIFPLHAEMTYEQQLPCFRSYGKPKCIVATNVAQTSITIPDIDAVVDSGLERRVEYVDGVEGLYIRLISLADREQRKGRAGRTKPGIYVDTYVHNKPRLEFPTPDIIRLPMDKVLLQFARVGVDVEEITFFHQPSPEHVQAARDLLFCLGCMDRWGTMTPIGKRVAVLPVSTRAGRMLIEAEDRQVLPDVITLVSVMERGRITNGKSDRWKKSEISDWSDAFVQLAAYEAALNLPPTELVTHGIDPEAFADVRNTRHRISSSMKLRRSRGRIENIVRSIYAGLADCLYKKSVVRGYKDKGGNVRNLPTDSLVSNAQYIVGLPWNLQVKTDFGPKTLRLITMATRVDPKLLAEVAPHLVTTEEKAGFHEDKGSNRVRVMQTHFNGMQIEEESRRVS